MQKAAFISAEPTVRSFKLPAEGGIIVLGSDGLWDGLSDVGAVKWYLAPEAGRKEALEGARCGALVLGARRRGCV